MRRGRNLNDYEMRELMLKVTMLIYRQSDGLSPATIIDLLGRMFVGCVISASIGGKRTRLEVRDQMNVGLNALFDMIWDDMASHEHKPLPETEAEVNEMIRRAGFKI